MFNGGDMPGGGGWPAVAILWRCAADSIDLPPCPKRNSPALPGVRGGIAHG